jgi:hypothetical protein
MPSDEQLALAIAERGAFIVPNPLLARWRRGMGPIGLSTPVVHAGVGPARLLVSWAAVRAPERYQVETSAQGDAAGGGEFRLELRVTENAARARAHVIEFDGQSWVRVAFEGSSEEHGVEIERLALHDASDGTDDVWLILGDELARAGLVGGSGESDVGEGGFAELVHERYPGYFPALIDETRNGERPATALARLVELLETHPHARHVAIAFADASGDTAADEEAALVALVEGLLARERAVAIARPPRRMDGREASAHFARVISALEARHGLVPGPDLGKWFDANSDQLDAEGRPTRDGRRAMQRSWLEALDGLYVPQ